MSSPMPSPPSGEIEFRNVTIRYDLDGLKILTDVNLKNTAGERVAVVRRTGSGKSTLLLSLPRFTDMVSGQILYDKSDITKVPRRKLRESVTIIPQEATLFGGSVRSNLDPTGVTSLEQMERALNMCRDIISLSHSKSSEEMTVDGIYGRGQQLSLSSQVDGRGGNFSHHQRQGLSLCRALIRKRKLVLLDEATASIDYQAGKGPQTILREELEIAGDDRTLMTIAHWLRTTIDYDSIVVIGAGRVIEYGSPRDLYNVRGQLYDMMYHSGELEKLQEFLEAK